MYIETNKLPTTLRNALSQLGYNRKDISVEAREHYCLAYGADKGTRAFVFLVNLETGIDNSYLGSWGGANPFNPNNPVDLDYSTRDIPANVAVIKGSEGGGVPVYAYIYMRPEDMAAISPKQESKPILDPKEQEALNIIAGYISSYRKEEFALNFLGIYGPENIYVQALAAKGLVKVTGRGVSITTAGRNAGKVY